MAAVVLAALLLRVSGESGLVLLLDDSGNCMLGAVTSDSSGVICGSSGISGSDELMAGSMVAASLISVRRVVAL